MIGKVWSPILFLVLFLGSIDIFGQLIYSPPRPIQQTESFRISKTISDTLNTLPFFEDFSTYRGQPDTAKWLPFGGTLVNQGAQFHPVSHGVASFDGLDYTGAPYEFQVNFPKGQADILETKPFDLRNFAVGSNLGFSFYWQQGGRGELPEFSHRDSLVVEFGYTPSEDSAVNWKPIWGVNALDPLGPFQDTDTFYWTYLPLDNPDYFEKDFRVRFRSRGTQSGSYDLWHVDYIYFDLNRDSADFLYLDRTMVEIEGNILETYHSVPRDHYEAINPMDSIVVLDSQNFALIRTLDDIFVSYNMRVTLDEVYTGNRLYTTDFDGGLIEGYMTLVRVPDTFKGTLDFSPYDSLLLKKTFLITGTDDSVRAGYDATVNNDLSIFARINQDYAYDNGNSEGSVGIRTRFGKVAYQYDLFTEDTMTGIEVQFLPADLNQAGSTIGLRVWKQLNRTEDVILYQKEIGIQYANSTNDLIRYDFDSGIVVKDSIYIGWIQYTENLTHVGYDQNTNSVNKIFTKTSDQGWQSEADFTVKGSLLLRPVFERGKNLPLTSDQKPQVQGPPKQEDSYSMRVGPNPSTGNINLFGEYDKVRVVNPNGEIILEINKPGKDGQLDLSNIPEGLYLLYFEKNFQFATERIFLRR